jgi:hypothetical protein
LVCRQGRRPADLDLQRRIIEGRIDAVRPDVDVRRLALQNVAQSTRHRIECQDWNDPQFAVIAA